MPGEFEYNFSFANGPDAWKTWMAPSVQREPGAEVEQYTRLNTPGDLDPNHIDGIGPIWLVSHLSLSDFGAPGRLDLNGATIDIKIRTEDFEANGAQLAFWIIRYLPAENVYKNYYVGLQSTNWAYTGGDFVDQLGTEWSTISVDVTDNPDDWTYAGNYVSDQGDWADRYVDYDLNETLTNLDATLHLVLIGEKPDQTPTGFLDIANIKITTPTPAEPINTTTYTLIAQTDEDVVSTGQLVLPDGIDPDLAVFSLVAGSETHGSAVIDAATGEFEFTPEQDFWGPERASESATFKYTVTDGTTTSAVQPVLVKVAPINDSTENYGGNEDVAIAMDAAFSHRLRAGTDVDVGERLVHKLVEGSALNGVVLIDEATGKYTFTPDAGFSGTASFQYFVSDGQINAPAKTVSLEVSANPPALPSFGDVVNDHLIPGDIDSFVYWTMLLADAGDKNASYHYGTWLHYGRYVTQDTASAAVTLGRADGTVPDATIQLASLYTSGDGVVRNYDTARDLLESLGDNAEAVYRLGILDDLGYGGPVDPVSAVNNYIEAAKAGDADAMYTLGRRYLDASGTEYQPDDAYFWLGVGLKYDGGPPIPQFDDLLIYNMGLAAVDLSAARIAELDAAIASWTPGDPTPVNDAPEVTDAVESFAGVGGGTIDGMVLVGEDGDRDTISYGLVDGSAVGGTVVLDEETGAFAFTPSVGFTGAASFRYLLSDGQGNSTEKTVTLSIGAGTGAADDTATVTETGTATRAASAGLLANDTVNPGAQPLTIDQIQGAAAVFGAPIAGSYGTLTVSGDGAYTYVADAAQLTQGQSVTDAFSYEIVDQAGTRSEASLTVTVTGESGTVITGSGVISGTGLDDVLEGGTGYDILLGLAGNDILIGGTGSANEVYGYGGDDTYVVSAEGDTLIEAENAGTDTVETTLNTFTLIQNIENLRFVGSGSFTGIGNAHANTITGGADADTLSGLGDNDALFGLDGDDILIGGAGNNDLNGGSNNDTVDYAAATAGVTVKLNGNITNDNGFGGVDTLTSIENATGSDFGDLLIGDGDANILSGGSGRDILIGLGGNDRLLAEEGDANTLQGGTGDDVYVIHSRSDTLIENESEGTDTVETYAAIYRLRDNFENLTNLSDDAFAGVGNDLDNVLTGGAGRDGLYALGGNDTLIGGGAAANTLIGGLGDDTYWVSAVGDSVIEQSGEGTDTVKTDLATYVLRDGLENLDYVGSGAFRGTGNAAANRLQGGDNDDILTGGLGADTFVFADGFGHDVITDFDAGAAAEKLDLSLVSAVTDFSDLSNNHLSFNAAGDAVIDVSGSSITLTGVTVGLLSDTDFIFS